MIGRMELRKEPRCGLSTLWRQNRVNGRKEPGCGLSMEAEWG